MVRLRSSLCLVALFVAAVVSWAGIVPALPAKNVIRGWAVEQDIRNWGKQKLLVSQHAMKLTDISRGFTIVMKAPDWKPVLYSDSRKVMADTTLKSVQTGFSGRFRMMVSGDVTVLAKNWQPRGTAKICNHKAQLFKMTGDATIPSQRWTYYEYHVAQDIPLPKQITSLIAAHYGIVDLGKLPLRYQVGKNKPRIVMDTQSITEQSWDGSLFLVPTNYKKVKPDEVMFAVMEF